VATLGDAGARLSFPAFVAYWWGCHAAAPRAYGETGLDAEALAQEREVKRQRYFRRFQLKRPRDGVTLLRAQTTCACIELSSGKPRRMPAEFIDGYGPALIGA
jgi:hypothetical protein